MTLLDVMDKSKWYIAVPNVDLWGNLNFADIYNQEVEFI